jgi:Family of unknown function (DUF5677)
MKENHLAPDWRSTDGLDNASHLQTYYPEVFITMAELDALGQRVLKRAADAQAVGSVDRLVGLSLLHRAITLFIGARHLLERSSVQPAVLVARSLFETYLSMRYLVFGGCRRPRADTVTRAAAREVRARYYYVATLRQQICKRQAILNGAMGMGPAKRPEGLRKENCLSIARLEQEFPAQNRRFGPLPCLRPQPSYHDRKPWYSFGFSQKKGKQITSIKLVSRRLNAEQYYTVFYGPASDLAHAQGVHHDTVVENGRLGIYSPYRADGFEFLAFWTCSWELLIIGMASRAYHPESVPDVTDKGAEAMAVLHDLDAEVPEGFH